VVVADQIELHTVFEFVLLLIALAAISGVAWAQARDEPPGPKRWAGVLVPMTLGGFYGAWLEDRSGTVAVLPWLAGAALVAGLFVVAIRVRAARRRV
jgi:hypothetical protein